MTSDEALSELKKCKDKLELGLITQEEFDSKKSELSKSIK
jgi:predicted Zn-dependent peptidase